MGLLSMTTCWSWLCFLTMVSQWWSLMVVLDNTVVLEKAFNHPHFSTAGSEKPSCLVQSSHSCVQCGDILKIQSMTKTLNFLLYLQLVLISCGLISILSLTCVTTWILTSFGGSMYYAENFLRPFLHWTFLSMPYFTWYCIPMIYLYWPNKYWMIRKKSDLSKQKNMQHWPILQLSASKYVLDSNVLYLTL